MNEKRFTYEYDEYNGNLFDNKMNTFYHIEDSDENIEVLCDRLNWLVEENERLKEERNYFERKKCEYFNKYNKKHLDNIQLTEENEQLKSEKKDMQILINTISDQRNEFHRGVRENVNRVGKLEKENEQLKQRNDRQAKQLDRLYHLIEEKDWRTLSDIIDDFKRCEEQLQREWKCYDD